MTVTNYKIYAIRPKAAVNLCTNPSFETGTNGWTTGGTNTIAQSSTVSRRGIYSCKCTYADNDLLASYAITITDTDHVAAIDLYIPSTYTGTQLTLTWTGFTSGVVVDGDADMTVTDQWQRIHCHINPDSGDLAGTVTLSETGTNGSATEFIYIDGVQIEADIAPTTYFDGSTEGNIIFGDVLENYWNAQENASTSTRTVNTRGGGELVDISDYCRRILLDGLGAPPVDNISIPVTGGGETYLYSNYGSRYFTIQVSFEGAQLGTIQSKRNSLWNLIRPDITGYAQPLVLRYQGFDDNGSIASEPVDIKCEYVSGLDRAPQQRYADFADITFRLSDTVLEQVGDNGSALALNDTLANADYIAYQDVDGVWHSMAGISGGGYYVKTIAQHPITKEIYIAGNFADASSDSDADYIAKWNGTAWEAVVSGFNGVVNRLAFDPSGNLYIGGTFTNQGDADGDYITMWDGSSLNSLGTGLQGGACEDFVLDSNGNLYAIGRFTTAGGVADTVYIAKWDGSVWTPLSTGLSDYALGIAVDKDDNIYVAGNFTNQGDANGDYIVKWTGLAWESLGTGANATMFSVAVDDAGNLYAGGNATTLGGVTVGYWGKWNGQKWEALGDGTNGSIRRIFIHNNLIYIGGSFDEAGDVSIADRIAVYIGNGIYSPLDINFPGSATVYSMILDNINKLYIGFDTSGAATVAGETSITNSSAETYPIIEITGPGTLQQLRNYNTGKGIFLSGLTLLSGEVVTLDLRPDYLTATSNFRGSIKNYLVGASNLDFPLIYDTNRIAVFMTGTDGNSAGTIKYKTRLHSLDAAQHE